MRKNMLPWLGLAIVPVLCTACQFMPEEEQLKTAPIIQSYEVEEYKQSTVMRGDLVLSMTVDCVYVAAKQEELSFPLGGEYIDKIYVSEGQQVQAGELLAELKNDNLLEQISAKEYELEVLNIQKSNIVENRNLELNRQDTLIAGLDTQLASLMEQIQACDEQISAEQEENMGEEQDEEVSGEQGENAGEAQDDESYSEQQKAALTEAASAVAAQKQEQQNQRESAEKSYKKQLQEVEDSLYIEGLRLGELKEDLKQRQIYAGIDGTVTYVKEADDGERSVKGKRFITVADLDTNVFAVSGDDAQYFTAGMQVTISCGKNEYTADVVDGSELGLSESEENEEPVSYLRLSQPDSTLEDGKKGKIVLTVDQRENVLYVNKDAIKTANGEPFVYMLDEDGLRIMQKVVTGLENEDYVEIISGLEEGESVIIE